MPQFKMEVGAGAKAPCISCKGNGGSGSNFVSYILEQFGVVFVDRYKVVTVLNLNIVTCVVAPVGSNHRAIQNRTDGTAVLNGNVDVWVTCSRVIPLSNNPFYGGEEQQSLYLFDISDIGEVISIYRIDFVSENRVGNVLSQKEFLCLFHFSDI